jgi:hypothetical protein
MNDDNVGSIIVYLILAVIGIIGSISNKNKKTTAGKGKSPIPGWFDMGEEKSQVPPPVYKKTPQPAQVQKPSVESGRPEYTFTPDSEGRSYDPYAGKYNNEGSLDDQVAGQFSNEGSMADMLAERFEDEGRTDRSIASKFAGEGISSLSTAQIKTDTVNGITEQEISDSKDNVCFDEEIDDIINNGFNLKKAILYSAILNRKEYAF